MNEATTSDSTPDEGTTHRVEKPQSMVQIAKQYAFPHWEPIYFHEQNASLRESRPDPTTLLEGDVVFIPPKVPLRRTVKTGERWTFHLDAIAPPRLCLVLRSGHGKPFADRKVTLVVDGETREVRTGPHGELREVVDPAATEATLTLHLTDEADGPTEEWKVGLAHLDPIDTPSGIQERLVNLGFLEQDHGETEWGEKTEAALSDFQRAHGLTETVDPEELGETKAALVEDHSPDVPLAGIPIPTGGNHRIQLKSNEFTLRFRDVDGEPHAQCPFEVTIDGESIEGSTEDDGTARFPVPAGEREAAVKLWTSGSREGVPDSWQVTVSRLDPVDTVPGLESRLVALGFLAEEAVTGEDGEELRLAIESFQRWCGFWPTQVADEATRARLVDEVGH